MCNSLSVSVLKYQKGLFVWKGKLLEKQLLDGADAYFIYLFTCVAFLISSWGGNYIFAHMVYALVAMSGGLYVILPSVKIEIIGVYMLMYIV